MRQRCTTSPGPARAGALAVVLAAATALAACGFQLRGSYDIPPAIVPIAIDAPGSSGVARALADTLRYGDMRVIAGDEPAASRIEILGERSERRVLTVDARGKVDEYELRYVVRWRLVDARPDAGERELIAPAELTARRDYRHDPTAVLGAQDQQGVLMENMRDDIAQRILFRIQAWEPGQAAR